MCVKLEMNLHNEHNFHKGKVPLIFLMITEKVIHRSDFNVVSCAYKSIRIPPENEISVVFG